MESRILPSCPSGGYLSCFDYWAHHPKVGTRQHPHAVAHAHPERSAGAPLAHDDAHDWHPQARHCRQVGSDRLALSVPLGLFCSRQENPSDPKQQNEDKVIGTARTTTTSHAPQDGSVVSPSVYTKKKSMENTTAKQRSVHFFRSTPFSRNDLTSKEGHAPQVSTNVTTGKPKRSASWNSRRAVLYPAGLGIPGLQRETRLRVL